MYFQALPLEFNKLSINRYIDMSTDTEPELSANMRKFLEAHTEKLNKLHLAKQEQIINLLKLELHRIEELMISKRTIEMEDPTANVRALLHLSSDRADQLRLAESVRIDQLLLAEHNRVNEQIALRAEFMDKLSVAEQRRIDAIRAVDVNAVSVASERASAQAAVLANQVSASAETLRALVATTASAQRQQLSILTNQITERIAILERNQYEKSGTGAGMRDMWGWIFGGLIGVVGIATTLYNVFHH